MDFGSEHVERVWAVGAADRSRLRAGSDVTPAAAAERVLDLVIAALLILFLMPLLAAIAAGSVATSEGPILFGHLRIGRGGRPFRCWKFRSMVVDADARLSHLLSTDEEARQEWSRDHKLKHDPRVTAFGSFLRRSSLDELPQLWNVIRGDMSLVGPRPIVSAEAARYGHRFAVYCSVRPGLTGLWQVTGRNNSSYRRRVAMDCLYVRRKRLMLDLWILAATLPAVLLAKGSY